MTLHRRAPLLAATLALFGLGFAGEPLRRGPRVAAVTTASADLPYRPHELIVRFETATTLSAALRTIQDGGGLAAVRSRAGTHVKVTLAPGVSVPDALARFSRLPGVAHAEPNARVRAMDLGAAAARFSPNDRFFSEQWHFKMLDAERAWAIQKGDESVVVAVLDTGIAYENFGVFRKAPDWGDTVFVPGLNVLTGDSHANDDNSHGTHVASTIAEATNNGTGAAGLAFRCSLMPVKVLDAQGDGALFDVAEGIHYAVHDAPRKANVINLSLGGDTESPTLAAAIDDAVRAGVVVVAAAGNSGSGTVKFPASHPRVIGVGAIDVRRQRARYSSFGSTLDVVAPGGDIDRDDNDDGFPDGVLQQMFDPDAAQRGQYDEFGFYFAEGTSQATAHVSALAALLIRQGITSPAAVQAAIERSAQDLGATGRDDEYGHGLIRPVEALTGLGLAQ